MATITEKIKNKVNGIDIDDLKERMELELSIDNTDSNAEKLLGYALYDTLLIILDVTHLTKLNNDLYSTWVSMIKDYWFLNRYDKLANSSDEDDDSDSSEVSSVKVGDTTVNFSQKNSSVTLNGVVYSTGTVDFDKNILIERYKKDLYRHRKLRWGS